MRTHTHTHTHRYTFMQRCIHAYAHTHIYASTSNMNTSTHTHILTHRSSHTHILLYMCMKSHMNTSTHVHTWSIIQMEFIFICGVRSRLRCFCVFGFAYDCHLVLGSLFEKSVLFPSVASVPLSKSQLSVLCSIDLCIYPLPNTTLSCPQ